MFLPPKQQCERFLNRPICISDFRVASRLTGEKSSLFHRERVWHPVVRSIAATDRQPCLLCIRVDGCGNADVAGCVSYCSIVFICTVDTRNETGRQLIGTE